MARSPAGLLGRPQSVCDRAAPGGGGDRTGTGAGGRRARGNRRAAAGGGRRRGRGAQLPAADFTTAQRLDLPIAPAMTPPTSSSSSCSAARRRSIEELKRKADAQEPLPSFRLDGVKLTFNLDADYEVVRTQLTQNVVAIVEGSDPRAEEHVRRVRGALRSRRLRGRRGRSTSERPSPRSAPRRASSSRGAENDRIWNGADDDGSGTVAMMALAKAFAEGPRPKRSLLFVWHAGEERGLLGSRFFADYPTVPLERIVTQLNIDMVGRNRDDKPSESQTPSIWSAPIASAPSSTPSRAPRTRRSPADDARLRVQRSGRSRAAVLPQRPLQLCRRKAFRLFFSRPGCIPTTT